MAADSTLGRSYKEWLNNQPPQLYWSTLLSAFLTLRLLHWLRRSHLKYKHLQLAWPYRTIIIIKVSPISLTPMHQKPTHPHWKVCCFKFQNYRLSTEAMKYYKSVVQKPVLREKKIGEKKNLSPLTSLHTEFCNPGNQSTSYVLPLHQGIELQGENPGNQLCTPHPELKA